jgi:hypothetical protein
VFLHCRLQETKQSGLLNRISKQIWSAGNYKAVQQLESNVTLGAVSIIFVILIAGVTLSIILLVVENCWYKLRHDKREREVSSFKW